MGLDMYLCGEKYAKKGQTEDGFPISKVVLEIAYWRKHPNLHGFIVQTFAEGKDDCQKIYLGQDDLVTIIDAIKEDRLPDTTGFFFGVSEKNEEAKNYDLEVFSKALRWAKETYSTVYYVASW